MLEDRLPDGVSFSGSDVIEFVAERSVGAPKGIGEMSDFTRLILH